MKFTKMHGIGNDYVYFDTFDGEIDNKVELVKFVSDRHFGIGGDGAIFINPSTEADCEMEMYNADGSRSEMCGNGIRCVGKYLYDNGLTDKTEISVISAGKIKYLSMTAIKEEKNPLTGLTYGKRADGTVIDTVRVDMGEAILKAEEIPVDKNKTGVIKSDKSAGNTVNTALLGIIEEKDACIRQPIDVGGEIFEMTCVSMGNPHAVFYVDNVDDYPVSVNGPVIENHKAFPNRVNAEFVKVLDRKNIQMRVWERGTGETFACGTGACAVAVASILNGYTDDEVTIHLLGGDLKIRWDKDNNHVFMTGSATTVCTGDI
ncbi:MAG: diaminopimelate epimerase [Lachnospiraceae bacterium]|nr:diaminopimelate epimerase [Lachnospiraceae bacterium]